MPIATTSKGKHKVSSDDSSDSEDSDSESNSSYSDSYRDSDSGDKAPGLNNPQQIVQKHLSG